MKTVNVFARTSTAIGRSVIYQPKTQFSGGSIKWFDDSKLIKKEHVYDLYKFDNMSISTQNDKCNISFDTFNLKDSSHIDYNVFICYYDNNNKLIRCLEFAFDDTNIGDKKHYDIETVEDVSNAYDYKVE